MPQSMSSLPWGFRDLPHKQKNSSAIIYNHLQGFKTTLTKFTNILNNLKPPLQNLLTSSGIMIITPTKFTDILRNYDNYPNKIYWHPQDLLKSPPTKFTDFLKDLKPSLQNLLTSSGFIKITPTKFTDILENLKLSLQNYWILLDLKSSLQNILTPTRIKNNLLTLQSPIMATCNFLEDFGKFLEDNYQFSRVVYVKIFIWP